MSFCGVIVQVFSFVLRKRASTIGTRIPLPKRAISRSSGDSLKVPESPLHIITCVEMNPDFQCIRQILFNLLLMYTTKNATFVDTMRSCSNVLRQVINSPQHPAVKNWSSELLAVINSQLDTGEQSKIASDEKISDEYLDIQDQIINCTLPVSKDDASLFAAIQLSIEENWPHNKRNYRMD